MGRRVAVDIGGTFTDFCVFDEDSRTLSTLKILSTPGRPGAELIEGVRALARRDGIAPSEITWFTHGTTVGVNTVIQRTGAPLALFVTRGFEDVLEVARLKVPDPYDLFSRRPDPLVPRERVYGLSERMLKDGTIETEVDPEEVHRATVAARAAGADAIVVALLHSYANPGNERRVRDIIAETDPDLAVVLSSDVWPVIREYERTVTATVAGYVKRRVAGYLDALETSLAEAGVTVEPMINKSNGGVMAAALGKSDPISMLLSGTAAGVIGAADVAARVGARDVLSFDVGGTSADVAVIRDGKPAYGTGELVGEFPIYVPTVSVSSIGEGGGSIAWVDTFGVLKVGPESAGSDPGPACYGRGGQRPTITDAFALLGLLGDGELGYGAVHLDRDAAARALAPVAEAHTPGPQEPSGTQVMDHVFFLSRTAWKQVREEMQFDYIVVGTGPCGYAFAERVYHQDEENGTRSRILMIERGPFFLPEHFQNLPLPFVNTLGGLSETFPWTLSRRTHEGEYIQWQHGMVPFFGGRSIQWSAWCPEPTPEEMRGWPKQVVETVREYFPEAKKLLNVVNADEIDKGRETAPPGGRPIYGVMQRQLTKLLQDQQGRVPTLTRVIPAPLAVGAPFLHDVDFQKFATPGPLLQLVDRQAGLAAEGERRAAPDRHPVLCRAGPRTGRQGNGARDHPGRRQHRGRQARARHGDPAPDHPRAELVPRGSERRRPVHGPLHHLDHRPRAAEGLPVPRRALRPGAGRDLRCRQGRDERPPVPHPAHRAVGSQPGRERRHCPAQHARRGGDGIDGTAPHFQGLRRLRLRGARRNGRAQPGQLVPAQRGRRPDDQRDPPGAGEQGGLLDVGDHGRVDLRGARENSVARWQGPRGVLAR